MLGACVCASAVVTKRRRKHSKSAAGSQNTSQLHALSAVGFVCLSSTLLAHYCASEIRFKKTPISISTHSQSKLMRFSRTPKKKNRNESRTFHGYGSGARTKNYNHFSNMKQLFFRVNATQWTVWETSRIRVKWVICVVWLDIMMLIVDVPTFMRTTRKHRRQMLTRCLNGWEILRENLFITKYRVLINRAQCNRMLTASKLSNKSNNQLNHQMNRIHNHDHDHDTH